MPMPMPTADEQASERKLLQQMKDLADLLQRRNLDSAVQLAIQASKGEGPLVDHFMELGRRFGGELRNARWKAPQPARKKTLRVIDGGNKGGVA
jgi:hypothetical protein